MMMQPAQADRWVVQRKCLFCDDRDYLLKGQPHCGRIDGHVPGLDSFKLARNPVVEPYGNFFAFCFLPVF